MTPCSHGSQTGIRGGLPIGKIWQAKRLPYNLFRVALLPRLPGKRCACPTILALVTAYGSIEPLEAD
jgi:hypothetical protein